MLTYFFVCLFAPLNFPYLSYEWMYSWIIMNLFKLDIRADLLWSNSNARVLFEWNFLLFLL